MTKPDPYLASIEAFNLKKSGGVTVTKVRNGYNLYHTATDAPIARLNPTGSNDDMRIRFWAYRERRQDVGDFGGIILPLEQALEEIATNGVFWTWTWASALFCTMANSELNQILRQHTVASSRFPNDQALDTLQDLTLNRKRRPYHEWFLYR